MGIPKSDVTYKIELKSFRLKAKVEHYVIN